MLVDIVAITLALFNRLCIDILLTTSVMAGLSSGSQLEGVAIACLKKRVNCKWMKRNGIEIMY
jgi:hypothetical protein